MSILCTLYAHYPQAQETWNRGYFFSRCERCGQDLVRTDGDWEAVPHGHRVVWKGGEHRHSVASEYRRGVPVRYTAPGFARAAAILERLRQRDPEPLELTEREREEEEQRYPYLLAVAAIVGAGLQLLVRYRVERARSS
jgi:hypothetical protein